MDSRKFEVSVNVKQGTYVLEWFNMTYEWRTRTSYDSDLRASLESSPGKYFAKFVGNGYNGNTFYDLQSGKEVVVNLTDGKKLHLQRVIQPAASGDPPAPKVPKTIKILGRVDNIAKAVAWQFEGEFDADMSGSLSSWLFNGLKKSSVGSQFLNQQGVFHNHGINFEDIVRKITSAKTVTFPFKTDESSEWQMMSLVRVPETSSASQGYQSRICKVQGGVQ